MYTVIKTPAGQFGSTVADHWYPLPTAAEEKNVVQRLKGHYISAFRTDENDKLNDEHFVCSLLVNGKWMPAAKWDSETRSTVPFKKDAHIENMDFLYK